MQVYAWMELFQVLKPFRGNLKREQHSREHINNPTESQNRCDNSELVDVDYVSTKSRSCHSDAMLYIVEDNEAVIKMIITGRSPARFDGIFTVYKKLVGQVFQW